MRWVLILLSMAMSTGTLDPEALESCIMDGRAAFDIEISAPTGGIRVTKYANDLVGSHTNVRLADAGFEIAGADGSSTRISTDANGEFLISNLPLGEYSVHEFEAPIGYHLDSRPKDVQVRANEISELVFYDDPSVENRVANPSLDSNDTDRTLSKNIIESVSPIKQSDAGYQVAYGVDTPTKDTEVAQDGGDITRFQLDPTLSFIDLEITPNVAEMPQPTRSGNLVTWDLSTVPPGTYRLTLRASATLIGSHLVSFTGTIGGKTFTDSQYLIVADTSHCELTTPTSPPAALAESPENRDLTALGTDKKLPETGTDSQTILLCAGIAATCGVAILASRRSRLR